MSVAILSEMISIPSMSIYGAETLEWVLATVLIRISGNASDWPNWFLVE